jgi:dTDP-4-amino-4,6-dideoxygalactose transaminase
MSLQVPFTDLCAMTREVRPSVSDAWADVLDNGRFIGGEACERFEALWAAYCGTTHAVGVANGTDALQLTLSALGIGAGDEVIVPTNTFIASAEAVVLAGATPRFADVSPQTLLITGETLQAAITHRTRAVIVVHLYGQMPNMDELCRVTERAGLTLIEDAAQAHGATWRGRRAGSFGHAGCFSFYPGKNLGAYGDAGAVVTDDEALAERIRVLRDLGQRRKYEHVALGGNERLDSVQAAVLRVKLRHLEQWNAARRRHADAYTRRLAGAVVTPEVAPWADPVWHLYVVRADNRDELRAALDEAGIASAMHYPLPLHLQPALAHLGYRAGDFPVTEEWARTLLSLPMFPELEEDEIARVCDVVERTASLPIG